MIPANRFERNSYPARDGAIVFGLLVLTFAGLGSRLARAEGPKQVSPRWTSLFDGKKLGKWQMVKNETDFARSGKVRIEDHCLLLEKGEPATGVRWTGEFPRVDYEIELEAKRSDGGDFFCALSFPVAAQNQTLVLGGWGGWVVGLSCIDGQRAIDNETMKVIEFQEKHWYTLRTRVTKQKIQAWLDNKPLLDFETKDHELTVTDEVHPCLPLGIATWYTTGALRKIRYRRLDAKVD